MSEFCIPRCQDSHRPFFKEVQTFKQRHLFLVVATGDHLFSSKGHQASSHVSALIVAEDP
jgi:hypothetical protein